MSFNRAWLISRPLEQTIYEKKAKFLWRYMNNFWIFLFGRTWEALPMKQTSTIMQSFASDLEVRTNKQLLLKFPLNACQESVWHGDTSF
eukprot:5619135-Amphidinium_carterae.1